MTFFFSFFYYDIFRLFLYFYEFFSRTILYFRPNCRFNRFANFLRFSIFLLSANTSVGHCSILSIFYFYRGFPSPLQPPFTGSTPTYTIQYVSVSPNVVRQTFSLDIFVTFLNVSRFFTCHRVCIWSLFQVSCFFYFFIFIVYYCIFKDIISNILVRQVICINSKFVPGIKIVLIKNFVTKKKKLMKGF